eukprot:GHVL01009273.1.p1 GENE.GHVL01009273.1~~GHVL01009273.1.p1  ORF type:complete len:616 (-),score=126.31 GHVL01009273.1:1101-2948(-)
MATGDDSRKKMIAEACLAVDALDPQLRVDITTHFCLELLNEYISAFSQGSNDQQLQQVERRFAWLRRKLGEYEHKFTDVFPPKWRIPAVLSEMFCHETRQQLVEILGSQYASTHALELVKILKKSVEFERELEEKHNKHICLERDSDKSLIGSSPIGEYTDVLQEVTKNEEEEENVSRFKGIISECFEAYLQPWVTLEEQSLMKVVNDACLEDDDSKLEQPQKKSVDDDEDDVHYFVYQSAGTVFSACNTTLRNAWTVSQYQILWEMFQMTRKVIIKYLEYLQSKIPSRQVIEQKNGKVSDPHIREICCVAGTSDYCEHTLKSMKSLLVEKINESYKTLINVDTEIQFTWSLRQNVQDALLYSVEIQCESAFAQMQQSDWSSIVVGDQSPYVTEISGILSSTYYVVYDLISTIFWRSLCDRIGQRILSKFIGAIYSARQISEMGAQQLLLDAGMLRRCLLEVPPQVSGQPNTNVYERLVKAQMGKADGVLKVLSSSVSSKEDIVELLVGQGFAAPTESELNRILQLKFSDSTSPPMKPQGAHKIPSAPSANYAPQQVGGDGRNTMQLLKDRLENDFSNLGKQSLQTAENVKKIFGRSVGIGYGSKNNLGGKGAEK